MIKKILDIIGISLAIIAALAIFLYLLTVPLIGTLFAMGIGMSVAAKIYSNSSEFEWGYIPIVLFFIFIQICFQSYFMWAVFRA